MGFLIFIISCSPTKENITLKTLDEAVLRGDICSVYSALNQLSKIEKDKYNNKFITVNTAQEQFEIANLSVANGNYFSAYTASHNAYRLLPLADTKHMLIKTGKIVPPLLKAYENLNKSFLFPPIQMLSKTDDYLQKNVTDWNLINVNQFIEKK